MEIKPIAYFHSPFPEKFGIPRQAGLAPDLRGSIVFEPEYRSADALRGLDGFDYLWLIWQFSASAVVTSSGGSTASLRSAPPLAPLRSAPVPPLTVPRVAVVSPSRLATTAAPWKATVRPPRLGGNKRVGVFASRSPFRPNSLGLSSVRLESIDYEAKGPDGKPIGPVINVLGADLMDGTPIFDIKPYVEYADSHPGARSGFVDSSARDRLEVIFPEGADGCGLDLGVLEEVLSLDPRPAFHDDPDKEYGLSFGGRQIRFKVCGGVLEVLSIKGE